jgi:hypothetical protein
MRDEGEGMRVNPFSFALLVVQLLVFLRVLRVLRVLCGCASDLIRVQLRLHRRSAIRSK